MLRNAACIENANIPQHAANFEAPKITKSSHMKLWGVLAGLTPHFRLGAFGDANGRRAQIHKKATLNEQSQSATCKTLECLLMIAFFAVGWPVTGSAVRMNK